MNRTDASERARPNEAREQQGQKDVPSPGVEPGPCRRRTQK